MLDHQNAEAMNEMINTIQACLLDKKIRNIYFSDIDMEDGELVAILLSLLRHQKEMIKELSQ